MRKFLVLASVVAMAIPAISFTTVTQAQASEEGCRNTGTAVGAVGGAVVGSNLAHGGGRTGGAILGGLLGAVAGHQIAANNCKPKHRDYADCHWQKDYRDQRPYRVCQGRDGVWRPS